MLVYLAYSSGFEKQANLRTQNDPDFENWITRNGQNKVLSDVSSTAGENGKQKETLLIFSKEP